MKVTARQREMQLSCQAIGLRVGDGEEEVAKGGSGRKCKKEGSEESVVAGKDKTRQRRYCLQRQVTCPAGGAARP